MVLWDRADQQDHQELGAEWVLRGHKVQPALQEDQDQQDLRVLQVTRLPRACQGLQELRDHPGDQDPKVQQDLSAQQDH